MQLSQVDYSDIQGLVRFGHGHLTHACLYAARIADAAKARAWLRANPVTNAVGGSLPLHALHVAFTLEGMRKLGVPEPVLAEFSLEFRVGMVDANRSRRLGDVGTNDPKCWHWGGVPGESDPHVLIMFYAESDYQHEAWEKKAKDALWEAAFDSIYFMSTVRKNDLEPFGFVDGVSQPTLDWERSKPTRLRDTTKYTNLSALGEFLLGYPNEYGLYTDRPLLDAAEERACLLPLAEDQPGKRDFGRNGTYLVLRDLAQNVPLFKETVADKAGHRPEEEIKLASAMSGRVPADTPIIPPWPANPPPWPPGTPPWRKAIYRDNPEQVIPPGGPVMTMSESAVQGVNRELKDAWLDQFTFERDPDATTCPYGAHIRRANPRNADLPDGTRGPIAKLMRTLGFAREHSRDDILASTRFHRILRRGRRYRDSGSETDKDGLRFVALNANIARQFEFIQTSWIVNPKFNGLNEDDPLVGNHAPLLTGAKTNGFTRPQDGGLSCHVHGLPLFVTVRGGAYFFLPGLSALRYIARA
jgi:deferrochelatase/peroxidase EfeB